MKEEPLNDADREFITQYGLVCWLRALKLKPLDMKESEELGPPTVQTPSPLKEYDKDLPPLPYGFTRPLSRAANDR